MERRTSFLLLIVLALAVLIFGIWYLLQPFFRADQPPPLPDQVTPSTSLPPRQTTSTPGSVPVAPSLPQDVKQLQDRAEIVVSRIGSGASGEGFQGYEDVFLYTTSAFQTKLRTEQEALQKRYPAAGPAYGRITRVVTTDARQAVSGAQSISFVLQVQQVEDHGNPAEPFQISYHEVTVSFARQADGTYLVSDIVWKDIER